MWELGQPWKYWALNNWCIQTVVLKKTLESPLDCKEIKPVNCKGNQPWIFTARSEAEAESPILWPPDTKSRLIEKDPALIKKEVRRRRGQQRIRWFDFITDSVDISLTNFRDYEDRGSRTCYNPWGDRELDTTEWLNNNHNGSMTTLLPSQQCQ